MDFFTTEVLTLKGLTTYYVLFFIHLETRRVNLVGFTPYPDQEWMGAAGAKHDYGGVGMPERLPLPPA